MDAIEQQSIAASSSGLSAATSANTAAATGTASGHGLSAGSGSGVQDQLPPIHSFPPFFTLQPNPTTLITQLNLWTELVLGYTQRKRIWSIDADGEWERTGELFFNRTIDRRLSPSSIRTLLAHMVKQGSAAYDGPVSNGRSRLASALPLGVTAQTSSNDPSTLPGRAWIYWRRPDEWADIIYRWVSDTGQNRSIITFYELLEGDLSEGQEFRELPRPLLRQALEILVKQGKAQIFGGAKEQEGEGVKFA
ncbi:hypothetical protein OC846_003418 [Tilletia horrida]|uniref:ESCRT-II complex subunit VPS25 n=1 Tax=Tilletia horrida TaxID=155126 RepID=A0AAN6JTY8_9BASI|nr:hypothetical protein OC846_003418 [Tilletia horrida]KAK0568909.1 hypothetical protein OC861_001436 [Tilletia horrida]